MAKPQALTDLDVERVDGVDKPATGRKFLLFKSEDGAVAIMKGYATVATMAAHVLKMISADGQAKVSRSTAIALNGLAQAMGSEPVFVGKAVPTQPYEFSEPDVDKRGPADESLGANFTPRSMPGSMVGRVEFRLKDAEKTEKTGGPQVQEEKAEAWVDDEDEMEKPKAKTAKGKAKAKMDDEDEMDDEMDDEEKKSRGVGKAIQEGFAVMAKALDKNTALLKSLASGEEIEKDGEGTVVKVEKGERVEKPKSKQVVDDESAATHATHQIRKDQGFRFGTSFENIVFEDRQGRGR